MRGRACIVAAAASVALVLPPSAHATSEGPLPLPGERSPRAQLWLKASDGYSVLVYGDRGRVNLVVTGHKGTATYSVPGLASTRRLKARFGSLGRIAVRFRPRGEPDRIEPPKHCKGKDEIVTDGVFSGTIRFRGEDEYTELDAHRARGRTAVPRAWRCKRPRGAGEPGAGELSFGFPVLGAFTPHQRVVFAAVDPFETGEFPSFVGGTLERRGRMRIERSAYADGEEGSFAYARGLGTATVEPPSPFHGTASFARDANGSTTWSGSLAVSLPGAGAVPLTGPAFSADLDRPRTLAEFLELFGLAGLAASR